MVKLLKLGLAFLILVVAGYFAYDKYASSRSSGIAVIYPDLAATKIKPLDAGGIVLPNADNLVYDNFKGTKSPERKINLLPEPEQPLNIVPTKIADSTPQDGIDQIDKILASIKQNEATQSLQTSVDSTPEVILPNVIGASTLEETHNLSQSEKIETTKAQAASINEESSSSQNKSLKVTKIVEKTNKFNKSASSSALKADYYKIQLASVKSEEVGLNEGERIKRKFPKILGELNITVKKVQPEKGKFFYLVLAGPYNNVGRAKAACRKLSAKQQTCIVTR